MQAESTVHRVTDVVTARACPDDGTSDAARTHQSDNLKIHVWNRFEQVTQHEQVWRELEAACPNPNTIFQSYDWCANWIKACTLDNDCYNLFIVNVWQDDKCVLIWPLMTVCSGPFHVLRWLSDPYGQYGDVLIAPDATLGVPRSDVLAAAWQVITDHPVADSIRLRHVREDADVHEFLAGQFTHSQTDRAPGLCLTEFDTVEKYDARYNKNQRRRRKRISKNLTKLGPLKFERQTEPAQVTAAIDFAIAQKRIWLCERGLRSKPLTSDEIAPLLYAFRDDCDSVNFVVTTLKAGDRLVSVEIGLRYKNRHYGYITAHDHEMTDLSPGRLHMDFSQRLAITDKISLFDLMVPGDPHKDTWSNKSTTTHDFAVHTNWRGAVYTWVILERIRPLVRWLYLRTPASIRRRFTGLYR